MLDRIAPRRHTEAAHARNESADDYPAVVALIDAKTRVISCRANIQWIVQRKNGKGWRGVSFCQTKQALLRCVREWAPGDPHPALLALPDWFPEGGK
jgi:hypothetical protein